MADELPPEQRYNIIKAVGHGASGSVFIAWDQQLGRHVAIKRIRENASIEASIRKEAEILARLQHPNIVTIFDFATDADGPFVVMEFVEGQTLDDYAESHPLPLGAFLELVNQLCRGLSAAHSRGLLHLDLKPGNIMLHLHDDGSFTAKILDFGLAKLHHEITAPEDELSASPHTVAPEQLQRQPADERTDIYSLGCVFYYALTGKNAFDGEDVQDVLAAHLAGTPKSLHAIKPDIPEPVSHAVMKMIARDPAARPQTAEEARNNILRVARAPARRAGSAAPQTVISHRRKAASSTGGNKWAWAFAALAIAVAGYFFYQSQSPREELLPTAPAPPPSPAAGSTPPSAQLPSVDPLNPKAIAERQGQKVRVEGTIVSATNSRLFGARHLRFTETNERALVISIANENMSLEKAETFVGKRVAAEGRIDTAANVNRLVVEVDSDITALPPK